MTHGCFDLGAVTAPSGVLVLAMATWIDSWPEDGRTRSERALGATAGGDSHLYLPGADGRPRSWSGEAVTVRAAADRPLPVRALTSPSPSDGVPTISVLEADLGLPWPPDRGDEPLTLGDLPVDRRGMVLADAHALDGFVDADGESTDGLADVVYWGRHADDVHAEFGGERIPQYRGRGPHGWLDLPLAEAQALGARLRAWRRDGPGQGLMVAVGAHTDFHRLKRSGRSHPLLIGSAEVGGCPMLGIGWDGGDHSLRHRGERAHGQVYPATLEPLADRTVLRWTIPPYAPSPE